MNQTQTNQKGINIATEVITAPFKVAKSIITLPFKLAIKSFKPMLWTILSLIVSLTFISGFAAEGLSVHHLWMGVVAFFVFRAAIRSFRKSFAR